MQGNSFNQAINALKRAVMVFGLLAFCLLAQAQQNGSPTPELTGLSISGSASLAVGETATYVANATFSDGSTAPVAAKWLARGAATIDAASGALTGGQITSCADAALVAAIYSSGGITRTAKKRMMIVPPGGGPVCAMAPLIVGTVLLSGWNLVGHVAALPPPYAALAVPAVFGDAAKVTSVWKWDAANGKWIFHTPALSDGGAAYAASKGYAYLTAINPGEGFWVNATTDHIAGFGFDAGMPVAAQPALVSGWNLIAIGEAKKKAVGS